MFQFLYTTSYTTKFPRLNPVLHRRIYCLAGKYGLLTLQELALSNLKLVVWDFVEATDWVTVINETYANTERDHKLRHLLIIKSLKCLHKLLDNPDGGFSSMMVELGEYGRDMARASRFSTDFQTYDLGHQEYNKCDNTDYQCGDCHSRWRFRRDCHCLLCGYFLEVVHETSLSLLHMYSCIECAAIVWGSKGGTEEVWKCPYCHMKGFVALTKPPFR